jgi:DivIVA domain-containing protein
VTFEIDFTVVLRGYDTAEVDVLVQRVEQALVSSDPQLRAAAQDELRGATFRVRLRGYDRAQVDQYLVRAVDALARTV